MNRKHSPKEGAMPFLEHLEELRWRILKCLILVIITSSCLYYFWQEIFEFVLVFPLRSISPKPQIIFTTPSEAFVASLKISFFGGVLVSFPYILFQIWAFVAPGLFKKEQRLGILWIILSSLFFITGIAFSGFAIPQTIRFLTQFHPPSLSPFFTVTEYLGFIIKFALAFGLIFQMPVVSLILTRAGIITYKTLLKPWRYAIIIIFIVAAVITPPDVVSLLMMAIPLFFLFYLSIGISYLAGRKNLKAAEN
jgi:sec-independent protein translocase protein TatC